MNAIRQEHSKFKGKAQLKCTVVDGIKSTEQMLPRVGSGRRRDPHDLVWMTRREVTTGRQVQQRQEGLKGKVSLALDRV